jgi:hypothetical protein
LLISFFSVGESSTSENKTCDVFPCVSDLDKELFALPRLLEFLDEDRGAEHKGDIMPGSLPSYKGTGGGDAGNWEPDGDEAISETARRR